MKNQKNEAWVGISDKTNDPDLIAQIDKEFVELPIVDTLSDEAAIETPANRRDFLKYLGFGLGAATMAAGCDAPIRRAIPYVTKPDTIVPGVANYYASSFVDGGDYCAVLVKTREGRPIKIEGNSLSSVTKGGTNTRTQAAVLSLYDTNRVKGCYSQNGEEMTAMNWAEVDKAMGAKLNAGSRILIITNTILSPTAKKALGEFTAAYPNAKVVTYDPISSSAMLEANKECFGDQVVPAYHFDKAKVIVSVGADFLGTWISPIEYAADYSKNRRIADYTKAKMSRHIQVESMMSLTGSNADNRILIKPSEQGAAIANLYNEVAALAGGSSISAPAINADAKKGLKAAAKDLVNAGSAGLVVSGSNNVGEQVLINAINNMIGAYGNTLSFSGASLQRQGLDSAIQGAISEMQSGSVDTAIVWGANPAFDLPNADKFAAAFAKVKNKIALAYTIDETSALCDHIIGVHHFLESWGDAEPKRGYYSLIQPTIAPLFETRQAEEILLRWAKSNNLNTNSDQPYYEYVKNSWKGLAGGFASFGSFWDNTLHDGIYEAPKGSSASGFSGNVSGAAAKINKPVNSELEIEFFESLNIGSGKYANNPWLQEVPDPVTRCTWGNQLTVPTHWNGSNDYETFRGIGSRNAKSHGDYVNMGIKGREEKVSAVPQFGMMRGTLGMGIGYGREVVGECGAGIGTNVYPWLSIDANGNTQYYATNVEVSQIVGREKELACVQYHHTMGLTGSKTGSDEVINVDEEILAFQGSLTDRSIIRTSNLDELNKTVPALVKERGHHQYLNDQTLYPFDEYSEKLYSQGHHWGMHVDLNACTGCAACTVACMAENNVPVVGKTEVHRHHEMSWLRIDRYFYGDANNPNTVYQPMMCQHCDNAPCENVCPVAATNHSSEGLNQMTYNRCIGTRYCANNCPYKVRRFNWLDYTTADLFPGNQPHINDEKIPFGADNLTRMVLNPDVTVRSRGVIEKCSFCVQRIQEGKLTAKAERRNLADNDVRTACQTACPTQAIIFGDVNNPNSEVSKRIASDMTYQVIEEVNIQPSVNYSMKVNNRSELIDA